MIKTAHEKTYDMIEALDMAFLYRQGKSGNVILQGNNPINISLMTSKLATKNGLPYMEITDEENIFGYIDSSGKEIPSKMLNLYKGGGIVLLDSRCIQDENIKKRLQDMLKDNGEKKYPFFGKKTPADRNFMLIVYTPDAEKTFDTSTLYAAPVLNVDKDITIQYVLDVIADPVKYCPYVEMFNELGLGRGEQSDLLKHYIPKVINDSLQKENRSFDQSREARETDMRELAI